MDAVTGWRAMPPVAEPVVVAGASAPRPCTDLAVGRTAFATPRAGWVVLGAPGGSQLLYTDDAGLTWTPQLTWRDGLIGALTAFDARRAGLVLSLSPGAGEVNGCPVGRGDYEAFFAGTEDAGGTWTLGSAPHPKTFTGMFHFLTPRRLWILRGLGYHPMGTGLARTEDGGATWAENEGPADRMYNRVVFASATDGLRVEAGVGGRDTLYVTGDGGATWAPLRLSPPPGMPATGAMTVQSVARHGEAVLLLVQAHSRKASARPGWVGSYAYLATQGLRAWSGPHRLLAAPEWTAPDLAVLGTDGRFWAASGRDLWVADDLGGPWQHRPVPLPTDHVIADIAPVGDGVLWLTTERYRGRASGLLYRGEDDGAHWTPLAVA